MKQYICAHLTSGLGNRLFQLAGAAYWAHKSQRTFIWLDDQVDDPVHNLLDNLWLREMLNVPQFVEMNSLSKEHWRTTHGRLVHSTADVIILEGQSFDASRVDFLRPQIQDYIDKITAKSVHRAFLHVRLGDQDQSSTGNAFNIFSTQMVNQQVEALQKVQGPLLLITNGTLPDEIQSLLKNRDVVEGPSDAREAFEAMVQCSGGIAANSTFSWMAAQFQAHKQYEEHILTIPRPWARLQDWATFTSYISQSEPMTDDLMFHPKFTPIDQDTYNWTVAEFIVFIAIFVGILLLFKCRTLILTRFAQVSQT